MAYQRRYAVNKDQRAILADWFGVSPDSIDTIVLVQDISRGAINPDSATSQMVAFLLESEANMAMSYEALRVKFGLNSISSCQLAKRRAKKILANRE